MNPAVLYVPYYNPLVVFAQPRPGFVVARGITFGFGISIGPAFRPWGWGTNRFAWNTHTVIINSAPWGRRWENRNAYVHPYTIRRAGPPARVEEHHEVRERDARERQAEHGRKRVEDHPKEQRKEEHRRDADRH
ncbi:MAG: hypothetical protein ACRD4E_17385 [Bryobacteraceae bacterium]